METLLFYVLGATTLMSAALVVILRRPLHNVLFMIITMIGLAGLFILLRAEFVAMAQLVVYAGAIMVLFLFVIMLLNLDELRVLSDSGTGRRTVGVVVALAIGVFMATILSVYAPNLSGQPPTGGKAAIVSNTEMIAKELFTTYLLPFEVASVLLLAAIIGSVILSRKRTKKIEKG
jgi:NADH-quinone oxidoreductase subunit J